MSHTVWLNLPSSYCGSLLYWSYLFLSLPKFELDLVFDLELEFDELPNDPNDDPLDDFVVCVFSVVVVASFSFWILCNKNCNFLPKIRILKIFTFLSSFEKKPPQLDSRRFLPLSWFGLDGGQFSIPNFYTDLQPIIDPYDFSQSSDWGGLGTGKFSPSEPD